MSKWAGAIAVGILLASPWAGVATAADSDSKVSREREMLRRTQEALRQSQSDNSALAQSKAQMEQQLKAANAQLDVMRGSSKSEQASLRAKLKAADDAQTDSAHQLDEAKKQIAALTAKQQEMTAQLAERDGQLKRKHDELDGSKAAGTACEAKNLKLYEYSRELAQRYQHKGVWAALSQKEPVLGLSSVKMENVLQEYQDKLDSQRVQPAKAAAPATR